MKIKEDISTKNYNNTDAPATIPDKDLLKLILQLVKPYRKWLLLILVAMLLQTAMELAAPWPLKIIIDNIIGNHKLHSWVQWIEPIISSGDKMMLGLFVAIGYVVISLIGSLAGYIESYFTESVAQYVANDLRRRLYHHLHRLSLSYYDHQQMGKILSTITADVSTIQDFASATLLTIFVDAFTIIGMLLLMFWLNWDFTIIALGITPFLLFFVARVKKAVKKATREVRKDQSNMVSIMQEGLQSMRVVNAYGRQQLEEDRLGKASIETVNAALRARKIKSMINPVVAIFVAVCTALILWRGASLVINGVMTIGALTVFLAYLSKFFKPVEDLAKKSTTIAQATVSLERIKSILDTEIIIPEKPGAKQPPKFNGDIDFENVSFEYNPGEIVLDNLSLSIKAGQKIGICGPTGSGKSTVACLIPRFYDVKCGRILIDGMDVTNFKLEGLRKQIGFVLQDTVLFYGSVRDNIAYGKPGATEEEIIAAARMANAEEFIKRMPHGYDTLVGERGLTLSGGQRQRIGIARAIIRNSPVLILDEPTASLDAESEQVVMDALENLMQNKTVITIAHRLSTIRDTDKIVVIKDGQVAEEGTHDELIDKDGLYAELYHMQAGDALSLM
ncbi:MAG: ABC transporter ATP-binding protein [Sphingobacteriales bacterium]|nr:ABC transporter ATP-binding protein [Sphingobacteriales bacterium]